LVSESSIFKVGKSGLGQGSMEKLQTGRMGEEDRTRRNTSQTLLLIRGVVIRVQREEAQLGSEEARRFTRLGGLGGEEAGRSEAEIPPLAGEAEKRKWAQNGGRSLRYGNWLMNLRSRWLSHAEATGHAGEGQLV
jgi:hypothetical protein